MKYIAPLLCLSGSLVAADLAKPVQLQADGKVINTQGNMTYAGPLYGDLNGDGKPDLTVTTITGKFLPFINISQKAGDPPILSKKTDIPQSIIPPKLHNW